MSRAYRISTQVDSEYGLKIERLQLELRTDCGKRRKLCEIIEYAIDALENEARIHGNTRREGERED